MVRGLETEVLQGEGEVLRGEREALTAEEVEEGDGKQDAAL